MDRFVAVALSALVLAWLPGQSAASAVRMWAFCGVVPLAALMRDGQWRRFELSRWLLPWALLPALALSHTLWVERPGAALWEALRFMGLLGAAWLGTTQSGERGPLPLAAAVAGALAAASAFAPWWPHGGVFGNDALLAGCVALCGVATLWGGVHAASLGRRAGFAGAWCLQLGALLYAGSLGAWAAWGVGSVAVLAITLARARQRAAVLVLVVVVCGIAGLATAADTVGAHVRARAFMAEVGAGAVATHPLVGWGAGAVPKAWSEAQANFFAEPSHAPQRDLWSHAHHAHNEVIDVAMQLGGAGALLFLLPVGMALLGGRARMRLARASWGVVLAGTVLSLVGTSISEPATGFLWAFAVGDLVGGDAGQAASTAVGNRRWGHHWQGKLAVALFAGVLVLASVDLVADRMLVIGVQERSAPALARSATLSLRPENAWRMRADLLSPAAADEAWLLARDAARRDPSPDAWTLAGNLAFAAGELEAAVTCFDEAVRLHPWYFPGYYNLSRTWQRLGDAERSRRTAARARSLRPHDTRLDHLP